MVSDLLVCYLLGAIHSFRGLLLLPTGSPALLEQDPAAFILHLLICPTFIGKAMLYLHPIVPVPISTCTSVRTKR